MVSSKPNLSFTPDIWLNVLGMKFHRVPAVTFDMGSPRSESRRFADEELHSVVLTRDFYLSIYPVTQAEWRAVLGENPSKNQGINRYPVESVSWYDCMRYLEKINSEEYRFELTKNLGTEWIYSLPTEAQWEYVCRAGTRSVFYFGDVPTGGEANFGKGSNEIGGQESTNLKNRSICEVGSYPPNCWGFYDMCGNVCEWTLDGYGDYATERVVDPAGVPYASERVARGGSWRSPPDNCRSASRFNFLPTYRGDNCGLRLAIVRS